MAIVHLNVRRQGVAQPFFVFGLGEGTANVPILGFTPVDRAPVYTLRPRPGNVGVRRKTAEEPAALTIAGRFGHPTAPWSTFGPLRTAYRDGAEILLDGNDHIMAGFTLGTRWVIAEPPRVDVLRVDNGIPTEFRYSVRFEEALFPPKPVNGDIAGEDE